MSISSIGNSYQYLYNATTKKIQTSQPNANDSFVKWFNGELTDNQLPEELNGFDYNRKRDIQNLFAFFSEGISNSKVYRDLNGDKVYEISGEIIDAVTADYSVNGEKVMTVYDSVLYSESEIAAFSTITQPYKTREAKGYNAIDNSVNISVGEQFDLGNGYKITILDDSVYAEGYGKGSEFDDARVNHLVGGLNALIHFADQQWFSSMILQEDTGVLLEFLEGLGVDTEKEFQINETRCEIRNGRIREVGNESVVPSSIYNRAVKRYEEHMYQSLRNK